MNSFYAYVTLVGFTRTVLVAGALMLATTFGLAGCFAGAFIITLMTLPVRL